MRLGEAVAGLRPRAVAIELARETGPVAAVAAFVVFALNFGSYRVFGDGEEYFSFVQRLFGDRADGSGYNFGVGLLNAPFYGTAKVAHAVTHVTTEARATEASITVASIAYVSLAAVASAWLLHRLDLPARGTAVAAAIFGTPIWYYGSLSAPYSHAADGAIFAAAAVALWKLWSTGRTAWAITFGAALGLAVAVRPFNAGIVAGAVLALAALRRVREALVAGAVAAASFALLAAIPLALGTGLRDRVSGATVAEDDVLGFAPLSPLRMLFSLHRGLFVWTPVTLLAVVGIMVLLRRGTRDRGYVVALTSMAAGLLLVHTGLRWWDGGWSFSHRFFSSLVPLYAIGIAGLALHAGRARRPLVVGAVAAATAWSVFLGLNHAYGASQDDGADDLVGMYLRGDRTPSDFVELTWSYSRVRHVVERAA